MSGRLVVIIGAMGSGKTEVFLRMIRDYKNQGLIVNVFKPIMDTRTNPYAVESRSGSAYRTAIPVSHGEEIYVADIDDAIFIDEAQFIPNIFEYVRNAQEHNVDVIISALSSDYRNLPFGEIGELLAVADDIIMVKATCDKCGGTATRTYRTVESEDLILIGGEESYGALCHKCWEKR